jgi:hypothetical protein
LPSCKFHLPGPDENEWRVSEYHWTTARLLEAWSRADDLPDTRMPLEKDFSPTLAGSDRALIQPRILDWLRTVPALIRREAASPDERGRPVCVGLKLFNALFDDAFQVAMLEAIHDAGASRPDYFIYGNRLFDPQREFDGHRGIACGGPDLSDRNLRVLDRFRESVRASNIVAPCLPWSATGNITTGRMALEYALRGASSFQLHTYFQLPAEQYRMIAGTRAQKALHELYFHPQTGWIAWMHHLAHVLALSRTPLRFQDAVGRADDVAIERSRQANSS